MRTICERSGVQSRLQPLASDLRANVAAVDLELHSIIVSKARSNAQGYDTAHGVAGLRGIQDSGRD